MAEPTASVSITQGPNAELGKQPADAINADPSLKGSKVTVHPEDKRRVTLSGATDSRAQAKRIGEIAAEKVGVENVTNAIRDSQVTFEETPSATAGADSQPAR